MKFVPGQVVNLKSGGQPLTVVALDGDSVECIWLGEEGDLFRESIPAVALELAFGDESADLNSADEREFANARAVANDDDDEKEDEEDEDDEDGTTKTTKTTKTRRTTRTKKTTRTKTTRTKTRRRLKRITRRMSFASSRRPRRPARAAFPLEPRPQLNPSPLPGPWLRRRPRRRHREWRRERVTTAGRRVVSQRTHPGRPRTRSALPPQ